MFDNYPIRGLCLSICVMLSVLLMAAPASAGKPDLRIQFLDMGPTAPNPPLTDRPTSFYAVVVNAGTQASKGPCTVMCELDGKVVKSWQFPVKHELKDYKPGAENTIPSGQGRLYQYVTMLKEGRHTVRWQVYTTAKNEIKATVEAQQAPDLVVTIWPTGERVLAYKETEWNVQVKNIGGGKAAGPFVTLFRSVPMGGAVASLQFPPGKYLAKDEAYTFKIGQLYNSLGPVTVSAIVDYYGDVTEALSFGDDNNSVEKQYVPQYVDLEVSTLEIKPAQLTTAEPVEISFAIQNKGSMDAEKAFNVGILIKDQSTGAISLIDAVEAAPLPAGQSEQLTKKIALSRPGTYSVQVVADAAMIGPNPTVLGRQYGEPDNANNAKEGQFTIAPAAAAAPEVALTSQESLCKPGKSVVTLYRIVSECSTGSIQPYTGFIPPIKRGNLRRVTNTPKKWKVKMVDAFNLKGVGGSASNLKGTGGDAKCEKYGGHCWELIPQTFLAPGESWTNTAVIGLNSGRFINACLEPLTNDAFPQEIELEYEYECLE